MREFRESDHTYWVDGKQYVGVSELLQAEGLAKDISKFIPADRLDFLCAKGKTVHKIAELTIRGTLKPETVDTRLSNQKAQIDQFIKDYGVSPLHIEEILWDDAKLFAGQLDLIAETNKGLAIIDWKGKMKACFQLHCYRLLAKAYLKLDIKKLIEVQLSDEGKSKVTIYEPDKKVELLILSALLLFNHKKGVLKL